MTFGFDGYPASHSETTGGEQQENQFAYIQALGKTMSQGKLKYGEMDRVGNVVCGSTDELAEIFGLKNQ